MFFKALRFKKKGELFLLTLFLCELSCPNILIFDRGHQDFRVAVHANILSGWDPTKDSFGYGGVAGCIGGGSRVVDGEGRCMTGITKKCESQGVGSTSGH